MQHKVAFQYLQKTLQGIDSSFALTLMVFSSSSIISCFQFVVNSYRSSWPMKEISWTSAQKRMGQQLLLTMPWISVCSKGFVGSGLGLDLSCSVMFCFISSSLSKVYGTRRIGTSNIFGNLECLILQFCISQKLSNVLFLHTSSRAVCHMLLLSQNRKIQ